MNASSKFAVGEFATFLKGQLAAGGTEKLDTSSGEENVYKKEFSWDAAGPQFNGIKFGGGSKDGTVTLHFAAGTNINKVVVGCSAWKDTDTVTIGGVTKTPTLSGATAVYEEITFEFTATNSVTITTHFRAVFNYISVYQAA